MNTDEKSPEKIYKEKCVFYEVSDWSFKWSDVKHIEFQDDDKITSGYVEGYYTENLSMDAHYRFEVTRTVLETDEEFNERQNKISRDKDWAKKQRYETYLKLKKEFDVEDY